MSCAATLNWNQIGLRAGLPPARQRYDAPNARMPPRRGEGRSQSAVAERGFSATEPRTARAEGPLEIDWAQIVRRCMDGDSAAWAEMVRAHHRRVYSLCYRFTGNAADAEDLTQDVFLKIYSNLSGFDGTRGSLVVWIATMTRNHLVDHFRRNRNLRATSSLDEGWDAAEELRPADRLVANGVSPHEAAVQKELAKMVQEALARVSADLREAVI